jgi:uncharacterized protein (TIGR03435 family)
MILGLICTATVLGAKAQSRVGQMAPALKFDEVIQGEAHLPRPGHAVLIEFWATWCPPCTASIPHLNELQQQFDGRGVDFLWVSSEDAATARPFLAKHPMRGTVALDKNQVLSGAFDARGLPTTILIDAKGRVAAITRSEMVNTSVLTALIDGKKLPMAPTDADFHLADNHVLFADLPPKDAAATVRVVIERSNKPGGLNYGRDEWRSDGASLKELLADAYGVHSLQIDIPDYLDELYSVQAWTSSRSPETMRPMMQAALAGAASIRVRHEQRMMDVLVLTGVPGNLKPARDIGEDQIAGGNAMQVEYSSVSAETIRQTVQSDLNGDIPVVLDSPVPGRFAFKLNNDPLDHTVLIRLLAAQGISLKKERRLTDVFVIEPIYTIRPR